jgi:DNA-directed RNA polymerase subunit RPC12/RpoP
MLNEIYVAGFFDGEGSIHIGKDGRPQVAITQKKTMVLEMVKEKYGGQIYSKSLKSGSSISHWRITARETIIQFLTDILPHSIVKKEEIEIGLKSAYLMRTINVGCNPLSTGELADRLKLREAMQNLRPNKLFQGTTTLERQYRDEVKKQYDYKCAKCGKDLKELSPIEHLIRDGVLMCRQCNGKLSRKKHKPLTKESIEEAMKSTGNLDEVAKKLGIVRCTLYKKRIEYGMESRYNPEQKLGKII